MQRAELQAEFRTSVTDAEFTPVRIVCANTLAMAHSHELSKLLRVRHTVSQKATLDAIRDTINLVDQEFNATGAQYAKLMTCGISMSDLRRFVKLVVEVDPDMPEKAIGARKRNTIDAIVNLAINGKGQVLARISRPN